MGRHAAKWANSLKKRRKETKEFFRSAAKAVNRSKYKIKTDYYLVLSCIVFHLNIGGRWKSSDYPRSLFSDIHLIRHLSRNRLILGYPKRIVACLLMFVADLRTTQGGCHEGDLGAYFFNIDRPRIPSCFREAGLFISIFAAYLKRSGDMLSALSLYQAFLQSPKTAYVGHLGIGDINHLLARWCRENKFFSSMGGMPARPLPGGNGTRDLMDHLDNFTFENAIQHFQAAITLKPTDAIGHEALGRAAWDIGDIHLAASEFGKTVSINPDDPFHRFRLLYAKALLGDNSAISKISHLQRKHPYLQHRFGKIQLGTIIPSSYDTNRGETIEVPYIAVSRSETRKLCPTLTLQSGDVLKLKNAREIGIGLVATKEGIIDSNRKHLGPYCLKMFSPNILAYSGDRALLGLPRGLAVVHEGVVLPGAYFNYYHFLFEALGSLLLNPVRRGYNLVTDAPLKQWQSTLFQKTLGYVPEVTIAPNGVEIENATALPLPSRHNVPSPKAIMALREKLSKHHPEPLPGKRLYLSRRKVDAGRKINDTNLKSLLNEFGISYCDPGEMSIDEQIETFKDAEMIVAPQGAALSNLIFCPRQTVVVGMSSPNHHSECFTTIAAVIGQPYILSLSPTQTIPRAFFVWSVFEVDIDLVALRAALELAETRIYEQAEKANA
ncbi:Capsular polysaccharide biosynthesis protein [Afipia felis]|uniref:Capsular polysaccharide biosynthesis protein n=1 Tax=Afipia felis TaxID=1035 RepID=A0A090MNT9_AFIFE|nr:glycosyltransferase 61 family protein [Afipia felis]CEG09075.1 Capsular polysaccharide biosynthesis protein [Afipia felis]